MSEALYADVDRYLEQHVLARDANLMRALEAAATAADEAGLRPISVSPVQGKLLALLVRLHGARRVLEIGTLGGYSAIWMASALPADGHLLTIEIDPVTARIARENITRAALPCPVIVREGAAMNVLEALVAERPTPYDFVFIDADKENIPAYVRRAMALSRPGGVIVVDNVVRGGRVLEKDTRDPNVRGVQDMFRLLAAEPRLSATAIQTVGSKGHDGFALAVIT